MNDKRCGKCKFFVEEAENGSCHWLPPETKVIMANTMGGQSPAVMSYRPKIESADIACNFYDEDLDRDI